MSVLSWALAWVLAAAVAGAAWAALVKPAPDDEWTWDEPS